MNSLIYSKELSVVKDGVNNAILLAKHKAEYGNVKQRFFLDKTICISKGGSSELSFIGAVELNGANLKCHPQGAISNVRLFQNGKEYLLLSDAGVKTAAIGNYRYPAKRVAFANFIGVYIDLRSAYFSPTTAVEIAYKVGNSEVWQTKKMDDYSCAANVSETISAEFSFYDISNVSESNVVSVLFKIALVNENMRYYLPEQRCNIDDAIARGHYARYDYIGASSQTAELVFLPRRSFDRAISLLNYDYEVASGGFLYTTPYLENLAPDGYYEGITSSFIKVYNGEMVLFMDSPAENFCIVLTLFYRINDSTMKKEVCVAMYYSGGVVNPRDITLIYSIVLLDENYNQCSETALHEDSPEGSLPNSTVVNIPKGEGFFDYTGFAINIESNIDREYRFAFADVSLSLGDVDASYMLDFWI